MWQGHSIGLRIEQGFDAAYLLALWMLVLAMQRRFGRLQGETRRCAAPWPLAFTLLALGDSAHVGLRLLDLSQLPVPPGWIGTGALATAITVTLFDLLLLQAHQRLAPGRCRPLSRLLLVIAALRLLLLALPQNHWSALVPPQPWSLLRNLPLLALTVAIGALVGSFRGEQRHWARWIGALLLASALCHLPVMLWIQAQPLLGLLMIPKSVAYLAIAAIAYRRLASMAPISSR